MLKEVKRKKKKDKIAATLMLCFCVIALTSIFTIKANIQKLQSNAKEVTVSNKQATDKSTEHTSKDSTSAKNSTDVSASTPIVDSKKQEVKKVNYICPIIGGTVSKEYSMDMIIYSLTLDQFMTHPGCDIISNESNNVVAASAGTVTKVFKDDKYGITVEITHSNGIVSRYCNLNENTLVETGDSVAQGQSIGKVGKTALYESAEKPHLHLEFLKKGNLQNPASYISF